MTRTASFEQRFRAALAHLNAGQLDAAAAEYRALQRTACDDPAVLQLHATVALRAGDPAEARDAIERSLRSRPGHVPSLLLAARAALAAALPAYRRAVQIRPVRSAASPRR